MGCCDVSDREDEHHPYETDVGSGKRFKLPKKFFYDCNGVNNSPVPRKLRSAMKKRSNHESVSPALPNSKRMNQAIGEAESHKKDGVKKSKLNLEKGRTDWSHQQVGSAPITEDEEEVVETLYSLAGMFHDNDTMDPDKLDCQEVNPPASPVLLEAGEGSTANKEDSAVVQVDLSWPSETAEPTEPSSNAQKIPEETFRVNSSNLSVVQEQHNLPTCKKISIHLDSAVTQLNSPVIPLLVKNGSERTMSNAVNLCIPPKQNQDTCIIKDASEEERSPLQQKSETAFGLTMSLGDKMNQQQMTNKEPNKIALWPGLFTALPNGAQGHDPPRCSRYIRSSNVKVPAWFDNSTSVSGQNSFENASSSGKVSQVRNGKISWKRCVAHVYISHQIRALKMSDGGNRAQLYPKQGVLARVNNFNGIINNLDGVSSGISSSNCSDKISNEINSDIYSHGKLYQEETHASVPSREYPSSKQDLDFLSLSAGSHGIETSSCLGRTVNGSEQSSQRLVPYLQSCGQHPMLMSLSLPQMPYTATYPGQPAAATRQAQLQLHHPYLGRPFCVPDTSTTTLTKQQQLQNQQRRFWTSQLASQYRPAGTSTTMATFPSWHNGRHDSTALIHCSQATIAPRPSSLELLGPKYPQISQQQQQQQLMAISSSSPPAGLKKARSPPIFGL